MHNQPAPIYHVGKYAEHFKRHPTYKEFEVSNLGRVRRVGERACIEPFWDNTYEQWRIKLVSPAGVSKCNVANLIAEAYHGARNHNQQVVHINGNVHDNNAMNLKYETIVRKFSKPRAGMPIQDVAPHADVEEIAPATGNDLPQYIVLDVGKIVLTVNLALARGIAALDRLDIYKLDKRGDGDMAVWVLGEKVE
jgi:hypothetical protein